MKAYLEYLPAPKASSWTLFDRRLARIPFEWHINSEFELTLTLNSRGQRFIGDSIVPYDDEDLVLLGPRIPHTWCSSEAIDPTRKHQAIVLWFRPAFLQGLLEPHIELRGVQNLFARASRALSFSERTRHTASEIIRCMLSQNPDQRLVSLLQLFVLLSRDQESKPVTSPAQLLPEQWTSIPEDSIGRVIEHLHRNYRQPIHLRRLLRVAALSRASLFRLFKHHTSLTVSQYVSQLRIGHACALLLNSSKPIAVIASEVGYNNLAHFNRQFLLQRKKTPRDFRKALTGMSNASEHQVSP